MEGRNTNTEEVLRRRRGTDDKLTYSLKAQKGNRGRENKDEETKHLFSPAIKATAGACYLQPVTCVETIPSIEHRRAEADAKPLLPLPLLPVV